MGETPAVDCGGQQRPGLSWVARVQRLAGLKGDARRRDVDGRPL